MINPLLKDLPDTQFNESVFNLAVFAKTAGAESQTSEDGTETYFWINSKLIPLSLAKSLVPAGVLFEGFPLWIKVADITEVIPEGVPNSVKVDEQENESQKTWEEWVGSNYTITEGTDGNFYFGTNASNGTDLSLNELIPIIDSLVSAEEFKSILPQ